MLILPILNAFKAEKCNRKSDSKQGWEPALYTVEYMALGAIVGYFYVLLDAQVLYWLHVYILDACATCMPLSTSIN